MFFETITDATTFWIKGREFSIQRLLGGEEFKEKAKVYEGGSLAIFRLAPQVSFESLIFFFLLY